MYNTFEKKNRVQPGRPSGGLSRARPQAEAPARRKRRRRAGEPEPLGSAESKSSRKRTVSTEARVCWQCILQYCRHQPLLRLRNVFKGIFTKLGQTQHFREAKEC